MNLTGVCVPICTRHLMTGLVVAFLAGGLAAQAALPAYLPEPAGIRQEARPELAALVVAAQDKNGMADLALVASGLPAARLAEYRERLLRLGDAAKSAVAASALPAGEALLAFLHGPSGPFRSYRATQTRVDVLLDSGVFNCVSSAVVYFILAQELGLEVGAVGTRDHAFCTVTVDGRMVDVETTIAYGYDPGRRQDFKDSFGKVTGIVWVPATNYSTRRNFDFPHLVELILQNLAADAQDKRDDITPLGLAWDGAALVGATDARPLLLAAYNNRAAGLNDRGDYAGALAVALAMESRLGTSAEATALVQGLAGNLVSAAMKRRDWVMAHRVLADWQERLGTNYRGLAVNLYRLESQDVFQTGGWPALQSWLATASGEAAWLRAEQAAASEMGITGELARLTRGNDWETGWNFLQGLSGEQRALPAVAKALSAVEHNLVATWHNRFAALANARKTAEARAVINEALRRFPDNSLLKQDLAALGPP